MGYIYPLNIRQRLEDSFTLPYQRDSNLCSKCPLVDPHKPIQNGAWGQWDDKISYIFIRNRGPGLKYIMDGPMEQVIQDYIHHAGITKEDGWCIVPLTICREKSGVNDRSQKEAAECCEINFVSMLKDLIHVNHLADASPPKVLILGADTFHYMFPGEHKKTESLKSMRARGPRSHPNYPGVVFKLTYDTNAQLENPMYVRILKADIQSMTVPEEEKLLMIKNYEMISTFSDFRKLMRNLRKAGKFSFDIESSGLRYETMKTVIDKKSKKHGKERFEGWDVDTLIGISFSYERKKGYYLPLFIKLKHFTEERETYLKRIAGDNPLDIQENSTLDDFRFWFGKPLITKVWKLLKDLLEDPTLEKSAHNGKFDCKFLKVWWDIDVKGFVWDTMLASYLIDENELNSLDALSSFYPELVDYKDVVKGRMTKNQQEEESYADIALDTISVYGAQDADLTFRLSEDQPKRMEKDQIEMKEINDPFAYLDNPWLMKNFYMPLSHAYQKCEMHGILFDEKYANETAAEYKEIMKTMHKKIVDILKANNLGPYDRDPDVYINLGSPVQKKECFFKGFGWDVIKETKKVKADKKYRKGEVIDPDDASTDQDSLKRILESFYHQNPDFYEAEIQFIESVLEYSKKSKMISTYLQGQKILNRMTPGGYIHYMMKLHGTVSGRLSSTPNVQNLPRRTFEIHSLTGKVIKASNVRGIFIAPYPYKVFSADLAQAELRIMADYANDARMFEYIENGWDIHWSGCRRLFYNNEEIEYDPKNAEMKRLRKLTKLCNFGGLYGGSDRKKVQAVNEKLELGEPKINMEIATAHTNWFNSEFPSIQQYLHEQGIRIKKVGWIDNKLGRRRLLPKALKGAAKEFIRDEAVRQGLNAQIQGTASDIVQLAFIRCQNFLEENNMKSKILWSVHDEILGYAHPDEIDILKVEIPKIMVEKVERVNRIKVKLEADFEVFETRWGD